MPFPQLSKKAAIIRELTYEHSQREKGDDGKLTFLIVKQGLTLAQTVGTLLPLPPDAGISKPVPPPLT